jgi:hypothetical protein
MTTKTRTHRALSLHLLLATSAALLLAACSGGGDSSTGTITPPIVTPPVTAFDPATLQGRWTTASGVTPGYTALIVPDADAATTATAWVLAQDASRLVKVSATGSQSANGKSYDLATPGSTATGITSGSYSANLTASPKSISFTNVLGTSLSLSQSDGLSGNATAADAAGSWKASVGAVDLTWSLSDTGALSGSSTSGCSYSGSSAAPAAITLYRVSFTETCSGTTASFAGIATLNTEKTRLTVTATTTGDTQGTALFFVRQ